MNEKLKSFAIRYEKIQKELAQPEVISDKEKLRTLTKEMSSIEPIVLKYREFESAQSEITSLKEMLKSEEDSDLKSMAKEELSKLEKKEIELEQELKILLLPSDPNDEKNVILEIRAGAGGDEASLFCEELFRAYVHFAQSKKWKVDILSTSEKTGGGFKEVLATISGSKVYSILKFESGVHRVQRVPKTETQGRVHTSTVTVAVLPEASEVDVKIAPQDVRVDVYRSSGNGGQSVNTTDSAVRLTHIPTGLVVTCQDGKSQHANKDKAFKVLYARLKSLEEEKNQKEASESRLAQIGTGDRSEKIRTYNFPQTRITDHRVNLTIHQLKDVMGGNLDLLIQPLILYSQSEALKQQSEPESTL